MSHSTEPIESAQIVKVLNECFKETNEQETQFRFLTESTPILLNAQRQYGYCELLHNLARSEVEESIKLGTLIQYKETVIKYWLERDGYCLSNSEKEFVRRSLIFWLTEDKQKFSGIIDAMMVHIVKKDFPDEWPSVFAVLIDQINNNPSRLRVLQMLYYCVKAVVKEADDLSPEENSYSIMKKKCLQFGSISSAVLRAIAPLWLSTNTDLLVVLSDYCQRKISAEQLNLNDNLGKECVYSIKIIHIVVSRFLHHFALENESDVVTLFERIMYFLQNCVECRRAIDETPGSLTKSLEKVILTLSKLVIQAQLRHPLTFLPVLYPFLEYFFNQLSVVYNLTNFWELYLVEIFIFFANVITVREYREKPNDLRDNRKDANEREIIADEKVEEGQSTLKRFFTVDNILSFIRLIISRYLSLTQELLNLWQNEPEEFIEEVIRDDYQFKLTPSAEYFFYKIVKFDETNTNEPLCKILTNTIEECNKADPQHPEYIRSILLKESCYSALAIANNCLDRRLHFKDFMIRYLIPDILKPGTFSFILKRRICTILENWSNEIKDCRNEAYQLIQALLTDSDLVVRVHAAMTMRTFIEDFDFDSGKFMSFVRPFIHGIIRLVGDMSGSSTTCHVLLIVSTIITALGEQSRPFMYEIVNCVSELWKKAQTQKMVLANIIRILGTLVEVLVGGAAELETQLLPVLNLSCDPQHRDSLHILDEGLILWSNMIEQSGFLSENLKKFFSRGVSIADANREDQKVLRKLIHLTENYILIGKKPFVQQNIQHITLIFQVCILNIKRAQYLSESFEVISLFIQMFSTDLPTITEVLHASWDTILRREKENDMAFFGGLMLFCRFLIENFDAFVQYFRDLSATESQLIKFIELMITYAPKFNFKYINDQKLVVIALSSFLETDLCLNHVPYIVEVCISILQSSTSSERKTNKRYTKKINMILNSPCYRARKQIESQDKALIRDELEFFLEKLQNGQQRYRIGETLNTRLSPATLQFFENPKRFLSESRTKVINK